MTALTGAEFAQELKHPRTDNALFVVGVAKAAPDDDQTILLGSTPGCDGWTRIPVQLIEHVVHLSMCACAGGDGHPIVAVYFKRTADPIAQVLMQLIRTARRGASAVATTRDASSMQVIARTAGGPGSGDGSGIGDRMPIGGCVFAYRRFCWERPIPPTNPDGVPWPARPPSVFDCELVMVPICF